MCLQLGLSSSFPGTFPKALAAHRAHAHYGAPETVRALHRGSVAGCAYGRVRPWQGALAGCVFSLFAFVSIFIGL